MELYDGPAYSTQTTESLVPPFLEGCIPSRIDANLLDPNCISQNLDRLYAEVSNTNHHLLEDDFAESTTHSPSLDCKTEPVNASQTVDEPCSCAASVADILDESIRCIGISNRQCSQLEKCGFYTVNFLIINLNRDASYLRSKSDAFITTCRCESCYIIFLGPMLIYRMLRWTLVMVST